MNRNQCLGLMWVCIDCYYAHHGLADESDHAPDREPLSAIGDALHNSRQAALDALRVNYADGDSVSDDELIDYVSSQGVDVHIDFHTN